MSRALTGIRPTGDLTVANYVGAMEPMAQLQGGFEGDINVFVADLHALTDQEPDVINRTRLDVVRSYMAAGVNPEQPHTNLYLQSQIGSQTLELASLLDRHFSLAELMRVPTLKDKIGEEKAETASVALARYPILMAADIVIQDATHVPVGKDQIPHIEVTRTVARRFNNEYGNGSEILVLPEVLAADALKIAGLNGDSKMSKSSPNGALFLADAPDVAARKIKKARTALPGETTEVLESHFLLTDRLSSSDEQRQALHDLQERHLDGQRVMGEFKGLMTDVVVDFLSGYQERFNSISDTQVKKVLIEGGKAAKTQAEDVMRRVGKAMNFAPDSFLYE